jgi:hypothetical protein
MVTARTHSTSLLSVHFLTDAIVDVLFILSQVETALTVDALSVIVHGISTLMEDPESELSRTFRRGVVYNDGMRGIQCRADPPVPWVHGADILKSLLAVI